MYLYYELQYVTYTIVILQRRSMTAFREYFSGEDNTARRIAEVDRIKDMLHY